VKELFCSTILVYLEPSFPVPGEQVIMRHDAPLAFITIGFNIAGLQEKDIGLE
jgi:hypothetical protein